jgi:hypothetical protein
VIGPDKFQKIENADHMQLAYPDADGLYIGDDPWLSEPVYQSHGNVRRSYNLERARASVALSWNCEIGAVVLSKSLSRLFKYVSHEQTSPGTVQHPSFCGEFQLLEFQEL